MSDALEKLVAGAQKERDEIQQEIDQLVAELDKKRAAAKQYDRVINAYNLDSTKSAAKPKPVVQKKPDWRVSSGMIEQIYGHMAAAASNGRGELTNKELVELTGVSDPTVGKTLNILHEQGRIRLVRKEGQARVWGVV